MRYKHMLTALLVSALVSGCGVFRKDWLVAEEYCETTGQNHIDPGDELETSWRIFGAHAIRAVRGASDWHLSIDKVEPQARAVWATATIPSSNPTHPECIRLQRADELLGETGIEIFLHSKGSAECEDLITETFMQSMRDDECGGGHMGGWKAF